MKNKLVSIGAALIIGVMSLATPALVSAATFTPPTYSNGGCSVTVPGINAAKNNAFTYNAATKLAAVPLKITGPSTCKATISAGSWNAPAGTSSLVGNYTTQQFFGGRTLQLGPGSYNYHVAVRDTCSFQVDLLNGASQKSLNGTANYGSELMAYMRVDTGVVCPNFTPPAPAPTPPVIVPTITPIPTPTPPVTPPATPNTPPAPVFTCNAITLTAPAGRTVALSNISTTAANGATFTSVVIDWGDNSAPLTATAASGQTHTYAADGNYVVSATAHFNVNGTDTVASNGQCKVGVSFVTAPPVTPPAPVVTTAVAKAAPAALVNTGPGSTLALFGAVTIGGGLLHRYGLKKRLSRV